MNIFEELQYLQDRILTYITMNSWMKEEEVEVPNWVAWVIVRLHNTCRNSPLIFSHKFRVKHAPCIPKDGEYDFLLIEQFWISLHLENLDDDIPWIAFCFPDDND